MHERTINVEWDDVADIWVATSPDVPGLQIEACDWMDLQAQLDVLLPELDASGGSRPTRQLNPIRRQPPADQPSPARVWPFPSRRTPA